MTILTEFVYSKYNKLREQYRESGFEKMENGSYKVPVTNLSDNSHMLVEVSCDSGVNNKCSKIFTREWRSVVTQRKRTNGIDWCTFCQKSIEYEGRGNPNTKYFGLDDNYFTNIDTKEKAYILGWIASDGSITKDNSITINIRDYDIHILEEIREILCKDLPISRNKDERKMVSLTFNSKRMSMDLIRHLKLKSAGKKDTDVQFPELSEDLNIYFIRGYFDGDGSVSLHRGIPRASISSNSIDMLNSIHKIIGLGNVYTSSSPQWMINAGGEALQFLEKLYQDKSVPYLRRKYNRYENIDVWVPSLSGYGIRKDLASNYGVIQINKSNRLAIMPEITDMHASGLDLHLIEKVKDFSENHAMFTTGLKVKPPPGYFFMLVPRSSISKTKYTMTNSVGIIDENYVGEVLVVLSKTGGDWDIELPSRLVQLVLMPKIDMQIEIVNELSETERGEGGFGSTGK